jgi:hypothetical protein
MVSAVTPGARGSFVAWIAADDAPDDPAPDDPAPVGFESLDDLHALATTSTPTNSTATADRRQRRPYA